MSLILILELIVLYGYAGLRTRTMLLKRIPRYSLWACGLVYLPFTAVSLAGIAGIFMPLGLTRLVAYFGGCSLVFVFYVALFAALVDVATLCGKRFHWSFIESQWYQRLGVVLLAAAILITAAGYVNALHTETTRYDITVRTSNMETGTLNIVMVSDTHFGALYDANDLRVLVESINALSPDLVVFTGDVVDRSYLTLNNAKTYQHEFSKLDARYGIYACMGNHEGFYGSAAMRQFFANTPVILLEDESIVIDDALVLIGRQDAYNLNRATMQALMAGVDENLPVIVLDHQPDSLDEEAQAGVSLVLSGHTHGGQVFPMTLLSGLFDDVSYGLAQVGDMHVVVSSGYGAWGTPVRLGTNREIVEIVLRIGW